MDQGSWGPQNGAAAHGHAKVFMAHQHAHVLAWVSAWDQKLEEEGRKWVEGARYLTQQQEFIEAFFPNLHIPNFAGAYMSAWKQEVASRRQMIRMNGECYLMQQEQYIQSYVQHMRYWGLPMPSVAQVLYTQPGGAERKRKRQERTKPQVKRQKQDTNCGSDATREPLDSKNYYEVLGLGMKASSVDIQNAFKRLALKWHPDKCADVVEATRKFKAIQHARSILKDTDKRSTYDRFNFDGKGRCLGLSDEAIEKAARVQQKF